MALGSSRIPRSHSRSKGHDSALPASRIPQPTPLRRDTSPGSELFSSSLGASAPAAVPKKQRKPLLHAGAEALSSTPLASSTFLHNPEHDEQQQQEQRQQKQQHSQSRRRRQPVLAGAGEVGGAVTQGTQQVGDTSLLLPCEGAAVALYGGEGGQSGAKDIVRMGAPPRRADGSRQTPCSRLGVRRRHGRCAPGERQG